MKINGAYRTGSSDDITTLIQMTIKAIAKNLRSTLDASKTS